MPIADSGVAFYGKAGLSIVDIDVTVLSSNAAFDSDDTGSGVIFGLGVSYTPIENLSLFAGFDSHIFVLEVNNGFSEEEYTQSVTSSHIGVRVNF